MGPRKRRWALTALLALGVSLPNPAASPSVIPPPSMGDLTGTGTLEQVLCLGCGTAILGTAGLTFGGLLFGAILYPEAYLACGYTCYAGFLKS